MVSFIKPELHQYMFTLIWWDDHVKTWSNKKSIQKNSCMYFCYTIKQISHVKKNRISILYIFLIYSKNSKSRKAFFPNKWDFLLVFLPIESFSIPFLFVRQKDRFEVKVWKTNPYKKTSWNTLNLSILTLKSGFQPIWCCDFVRGSLKGHNFYEIIV